MVRNRTALLSVALLVAFCSAGCPTRTIYYDAGADGRGAGGLPDLTGNGGGRGGAGSGGAGADGTQGTGGATNSGGAVGTGGAANTGGALGAGGTTNAGGMVGSGGTAGARGVGSGGTTGSGGAIGSGGAMATGGRGASGGISGHAGQAGTGGTGAGGSTGGAAGAPPPSPKALGDTCKAASECGSGHCTSGICCDQACQGTCQQCSATGHCQMPADDASCGTIACPTDTTCRDYATAISTNRCKAIGQCKTASDCSFVAAPTTRGCGFYNNDSDFMQFCNGAGDCVNHTVNCGGDGLCAVGENVCCAIGAGFSCLSAAGGCPFASGGGPPAGPYDCGKRSDCMDGNVCCATKSPGGIATHCSSTCDPSYMVQVLEICNPAASPSECSSGTCQPAPPYWIFPPGFYACQ